MDKEIEQYYDNLQDMFMTAGWKGLIEELSGNALHINSVDATKNNEDLYFRKGQLNILSFIINLESTIDHIQKEGSDESI
jgi:hypothetical protein